MTDESTPSEGVVEPPQTMRGILAKLGPGLIIAGSIVGSGELIATTATGAEAGFWLLWLILIGCVIKVFAQIEIGRYTIVTGHTTMDGMNEVPGPRARVSWLAWYWLLMFLASLAQLGGIVGGVGQAMAISLPLTEAGKTYDAVLDEQISYQVKKRALGILTSRDAGEDAALTSAYAAIAGDVETLEALDRSESVGEGEPGPAPEILAANRRTRIDIARRAASRAAPLEATGTSASVRKYAGELLEATETLDRFGHVEKPWDDKLWAAIIAVFTSVLLVVGRYGLIQSFSTALVALFTLITIVNVILLQSSDIVAISGQEILDGMSFRLPPADPASKTSSLMTALAAFGIIGVGASELVAYPYWCLEKGYARFTGPRNDSSAWGERARGWMRVMRWDAWCSMVVYTLATVAFYLVGAATLGRFHLDAKGTEMIRTLAVMYEPVFGGFAPVLFLVGAIAVLYSTYFVANAGHALVCSDAVRVFGDGRHSEHRRRRLVKIFSALFPLLCLCFYLWIPAPKKLVLLSGTMQALMLPMLAGAGLWFRYRRSDARIAPGRMWDVFLWISALAMLVAGAVLAYGQFK